MDRYGYELMQQLAAAGDRIDLCGVGLPAISPAPEIALMNLANPKTSLIKRLWHVRQHYRHYRSPDASDLHFSLYSWPLLSDLPQYLSVKPPSPQVWGSRIRKSPRLGGFRGQLFWEDRLTEKY